MRVSPIRDLLTSRGARFEARAGTEIAAGFSSSEEEYQAVREAVGLADFSWLTRFRVPEAGLDTLERYAAGPVANIRFGRVLHTLALNGDGFVVSDLYIANDDDQFFLLGESLVDDAETRATLDNIGAAEAGFEDISGETALYGIDGVNAWAVAKALFGADVLGLPYLSMERYDLDQVPITLIRAGKTSEFGYLLLVPAASAADIWERVEAAGAPHGLRPVGSEAHGALRLDGRFFNIHAEGIAVQDPLPLGLQWTIDFERDDFTGHNALQARRRAGLTHKLIGVVPGDPDGPLSTGDRITHGGQPVAEVVCAANSPTLGRRIGLALFDYAYAYATLTFEGADGRSIRTISMPPITAKSLGVKLDEM
jgi:glycine cleavage system aminomethyltransferase T